MAARRSSNRAGGVGPTSGLSGFPWLNVVMLGGAVAYGFSLLVSNGRVSWPPSQLLASLYTVAGCLALVGPIVLARREGAEGGLGELLWMTGGLMVWVFDAVALIRGEARSAEWATPLGYQTMGLTILAVLIAGWRCRVSGKGWAWTNVTGWMLGLFWVGMAVSTLWPSRGFGLASR